MGRLKHMDDLGMSMDFDEVLAMFSLCQRVEQNSQNLLLTLFRANAQPIRFVRGQASVDVNTMPTYF